MSFKNTMLGATGFLMLTGAAWAEGEIEVLDQYVRSSRPDAPTGAAFMMLLNHADEADRLISASSDIAARVELHTHKDDGNGVMSMQEIEDGIPIPAGGHYVLQRGGDHVMFMGLKQPLHAGDTVSVTLTFEKAGDVVVDIPVDLERKPGGHSGHKHKTHSSDD